MPSYRDRQLALLWLPSLLVMLFFLVHVQLDLMLGDFFWHLYPAFQAGPFWQWIYDWGTLPALIAGAISLGVWLMRTSPKWQKYRTAALMSFGTLLLAPGFLINQVAKQHGVRPRPIQIDRYEGKQGYVSLDKIQWQACENTFRSFPSGHASMGFYFLTLWRVAHREGKKRWAQRALWAAILLGGLLSWARMAQGGHFFSDIVFSAYIVWITTIVFERWCYGRFEASSNLTL